METLIPILVLGFFIWPLLFKGMWSKKKQSVRPASHTEDVRSNPWDQQAAKRVAARAIARNIYRAKTRSGVDDPEQGDFVSATQKFRAKQARQAKLQKSREDMTSFNSRDRADHNPHRHSDWGARSNDGLLSGRNILAVLGVLAIILYILSQIPSM